MPIFVRPSALPVRRVSLVRARDRYGSGYPEPVRGSSVCGSSAGFFRVMRFDSCVCACKCTAMPQLFDDVGEIVEEALRRVGKKVVLALPLGIGKPNLIANEFFRRARADASLDLTIFTALSLRKPGGGSDLEKRFIGPLADRIFGNYPDLDYLAAVRANALPANVQVIEFFFEPGSLLNSRQAQSHYLSCNYTHVARELLHRGVNVLAHVVAKRVSGGA